MPHDKSAVRKVLDQVKGSGRTALAAPEARALCEAYGITARRVSKKKPVVVLKAGRTNMGARAASSHTGALAGNDKIYDDVFKQAGVIRARSLRDLVVNALELQRNGVANSGVTR